MPSVASTTAQDFWQWIQEQGYAGSIDEQVKAYLTAEGYTTGSTNTRLMLWLTANGYAGNTLNEKLNAFTRTNTRRY